MNKKIALKTISLKDLWNVLRNCYILIIIVAVASTGFLYLRAKANYSPRYSSTATLYLIGANEEETSSGAQWTVNYTLANVVLDDSKYLLTSRTVLNSLGEELGISNGYGAFKSSISINNPAGTRVLEVTATASSPERAKEIVDGVCRIGSESINDVLDYDQLQIFEEGTLNTYPSNAITFGSYLKYGAIFGAAIYIIYLALFLFDTNIHTEEDIERYLGLKVIGDIPNADPKRRNLKSKYDNYKPSIGGKK